MNPKVTALMLASMAVRAAYAIPLGALPGGTDTAGHLFRALHIINQGMTGWANEWYGGMQFFQHYPLLFHYTVASLGGLAGLLSSYAIITDIFFIIAPLTFFVLMEKLGLSRFQSATAAFFFAFLPLHTYYLYDGRHPMLAGFVLFTVFWAVFAKALERGKKADMAVSGVLLSLVILTHVFAAAFGLMLVAIWTLMRASTRDLKRFMTVAVLGAVLASWWLVPFVTGNAGKPSAYGFFAGGEPAELAQQVISTSYIGDYAYPWTVYTLAAAGAASIAIMMLALKRRGPRANFALAAIAAVLLTVAVSSYARILMFSVIPAGMLFGLGATHLTGRGRYALLAALLALAIASPLAQETFTMPAVPTVSSNGRVLYMPGSFVQDGRVMPFYEYFLAPLNGQETILGWHPQSQSAPKRAYNAELVQAYDSERFCDLLSAGWVASVVVDRDDGNTVFGLGNARCLRLSSNQSGFLVFENTDRPGFTELNGSRLNATVTRNPDSISIKADCNPGRMDIKESYDPGWKATINGKTAELRPNAFGFMELATDVTGGCEVELSYGIL